jgi:hypothetical protein
MQKDAKRITIQISNPPAGMKDCTSLAHARRYVRRGLAEWQGGTLRFIPQSERRKLHNSPTIGRIVSRLVGQFSGNDSGFSTLPYPQRSSGNGPAYRALSKQGAGLG